MMTLLPPRKAARTHGSDPKGSALTLRQKEPRLQLYSEPYKYLLKKLICSVLESGL
jgi:hypothetical protein